MATNKKFKILAFDPGLTTTGWSLVEGSTSSGDLVVLKIGEIYPGPTVDKVAYRDVVEQFDKRTISLGYLREQVKILIDTLKPDFVTCEDIYINPHRPMAYGALCMWICAVRMFCRDYANKYLVAIPTKICKKECSNDVNGGKLSVQESLLHHKHVAFKNEFDKLHFSEHEADSIAVAVAFAARYRDLINKQVENNNNG